MDTGKPSTCFPSKFACPVCNYSLQELEPRLFSFNNPMGACPKCDGLGQIQFFDPARIVAQPHLSLAAGAIKGWDKRNQFYFQMLESLADHYGLDLNTPFEQLSDASRQLLLYGSGKEKINFRYLSDKGTRFERTHVFEGIVPNLERRYRETESTAVREELARYLNSVPCPECGGMRLRREARHVHRRRPQHIGELSRLSLDRLPPVLQPAAASPDSQGAGGGKDPEGDRRRASSFLINVGLDYLSLDRSAETLSGGEAQRIRLASQIGSGFTGVMYVLDEPSIGLHQRDNTRLLETLFRLRDLGNTVIVVEHDLRKPSSHADHVDRHGSRRRRTRRHAW
jgi:excinuclease ABC subunit A